MTIRIKDIAEKAHVSAATVSLVLNNKPGVSKTTRTKVLNIAHEMHYSLQKSSYFLQLKRGSIRFLKIIKHGHILNRDHDVFISDYIDGLEQEARVHRYTLEINTFSTDDITELTSSFDDSHFNGLIVLGTELSKHDIVIFSKTLKVPVVFIDTMYDYVPFDFVDMNNADSVFLAVSHLIKKGHKEIGFFTSQAKAQNFRLREKAYRVVLHHYHIPVNDNYVFPVDSTFNGAYQDMKNYLASGRKLPTAIFSINDIIAYGCIKAIKEKGYRIPDDVSIVGFDDLPLSTVMEPSLTTIHISKRRIGIIAMRILIERINSDITIPPIKLTISGKLTERSSVKKVI